VSSRYNESHKYETKVHLLHNLKTLNFSSEIGPKIPTPEFPKGLLPLIKSLVSDSEIAKYMSEKVEID
jgi:hypothetical protein